MPDADQQIVIDFVARTKEAMADAEAFQKKIEAVTKEMRKTAESVQASWKIIGAGMKKEFASADIERFNALLQQMNLPQVANNANALATAKREMAKATTQATSELNKETKELQANEKATEKAASTTSAFGKALQVAFGITIYSFISGLIRGFGELVTAGKDLLKSIYQLEVGIRVLRRSGMEITMKDALDNIKALRKEFGGFATVELIKGTAQFANLTRDMRFSEEMFFKLQRTAAGLAIINGRAIDEVQRTIALMLSSGYTEGVQRLGVSLNRVNITLKANEMGFKGNYMSLLEWQRGLAAATLLNEKFAAYQNDLTKYFNTSAGAFDKFVASLKDFMQLELAKYLAEMIGGVLLVINAVNDWVQAQQDLAKATGKTIGFWSTFISLITHPARVYGVVARELQAIAEMIRILGDESLTAAQKFDAIGAAMKQMLADGKKIIEGEWVNIFKDTVDVAKQNIDDAAAALDDALYKMFLDVSKLERDFQNDEQDALIDYLRDIDKIKQDEQDKLLEQQLKSYDKQAEIRSDGDKKVKDLTDKYNLDVLQANRQFNNQAAEQDAKYRERQLKAELDYQEKLRKLREGFLFDLEDALRERDARQILRLIRQYNLEKQQAARDFSEQKSELSRQRKLEIDELEHRRSERLRVLQEEFSLRLAQIAAETQASIDAEKAANIAKLDEISKDAEKERVERWTRYQQQLEDLERHLQNRINEMVIAFTEENQLTADALKEQLKNWEIVYGPNGRIIAAVAYTFAYLKKAYGAMASMYKPVNPATLSPIQQANYPSTTPTTTGGKTGKAEGGWVYANKPTQVTFGEKGPELGGFFPVGRIGKEQNTLSMGNMASPNMGGQVDIRLILSPDLEARIVNNTLNKTARILMEVEGMVR